MLTYIALLRGVNVGGNFLKMGRLLEICEGLKFKNARTYVQSGNVVFDADKSPAICANQLERALLGETRLPVTVLVRTGSQFKKLIVQNPFLGEKGVEPSKLHVTFLAQALPKGTAPILAAINSDDDRLHATDAHIYLYCPNGYGRSKLSNNVLEKKLGIRGTTRNWNTVNKLYEMAAKKSS